MGINEQFREIPHVPSSVEISQRLFSLAPLVSKGFDPVFYEIARQNRIFVENKIVSGRKKDGINENWTFFDGFYSDNHSLADRHRPKLTSGLSDAEIDLIGSVQRKIGNNNKPVVLLDFGGGLGFSMIRIASCLEDEIRSGKAAIVVSNLGFDPNLEGSLNGFSGIALYALRAKPSSGNFSSNTQREYSDEELEIIQSKQGLVNFVTGTVAELYSKFITLPTGQQIPIAGNIDVLNEMNCVIRSQMPDLTLAYLGHILNDSGELRVHSGRQTDYFANVDKDPKEISREQYMEYLCYAFLSGLIYLQKYCGLENSESRSIGISGDYVRLVFKKNKR